MLHFFALSIGTTLKGAVDDLDQIIRTLEECGFQNRYYIHCDGALSGIMMPFMKQVGFLFYLYIGTFFASRYTNLTLPND